MKKPAGTIDCTPSWATAARLNCLVLTNADSPQARRDAETELVRMGTLLDQYIAKEKEA